MVLSFIQRWLRTLLRPDWSRCHDFHFIDPVPGLPPHPRINFAGRAPLTRPSSPDSISGSGSGSANCLNSQSTPLLTILPPEIRCQIWEEVMGGHAFHVIIEHGLTLTMDKRKHFLGWRCESANPSACDMQWYGRCRRLAPPLSETELMERKHILALLLTCRRM
jgi:hypothetical protein